MIKMVNSNGIKLSDLKQIIFDKLKTIMDLEELEITSAESNGASWTILINFLKKSSFGNTGRAVIILDATTGEILKYLAY